MPKKQKKRAMIFCQFGIPRYRIQSCNPPAPTRPTHSTHSTPLDHLSSFSIPPNYSWLFGRLNQVNDPVANIVFVVAVVVAVVVDGVGILVNAISGGLLF